MKTRKCILFLIIGLLLGISGSLRADNKSKTAFLKQNYDKALILQAVEQVLEHDGHAVEIIPRTGEIDFYTYKEQAESMVMRYPNILDIAFSKVNSKKDSEQILDHIINWCNLFVTMAHLPLLEKSVPLAQVLAEVPSSKVIVDSFLVQDGQGWYSLSSSQQVMLPYTASNVLYKRSNKELLQFYRDYYSKVIELTADAE